jgi:hypothetical protein
LVQLLAYIDPGTGSLVVQALIATLVAVPFFFRQQIARAVRRFRGGNRPGAPTPDAVGRVPKEPDA